MGGQARRAGNELVMDALRGPGVPANILPICIWGIDGNGLG